MKSLLIDTSGPTIGAAAWSEGGLVGSVSARLGTGADAWLSPRIAELLRTLGGLDRVGVCVGPGAFTGLRVGVATALGLALSRQVGVACLSSLALRATLAPGHARVLALLDARKGRVYAGMFDTRGPVPVALGPETDVAPLEAAATPPVIAVGEGASVYADVLRAHGHDLHADAAASPVTSGRLLFESVEPVDPADVGLRYLREADARPPGV